MSLMSVLEKLKQVKSELVGLIETPAIIFIDMAGSTTYKDERGIAAGVEKVVNFNLDVTNIIKEKGEECKRNSEIEEYEICKYICDEVMAYFKGKSSSKVAVEIAIGIENHFKDVNSKISDEFEKYKPKIGIDFGEVLFAQYYENSPRDPHGLIVDRAARIVSLAKPCQILISEEAKNHAGDKVDVEFREKEEKKFKGIKERTIVREVIWDEEIGELGIKLEEEPKHAQVCGTYKVNGEQPDKTPYSGLLQIEEQGKLFRGTWIIGARENSASTQTDEGTGLLVGNALAFRYKHIDPQDSPYTGIVLYLITSDDLMSGPWTRGKKLDVGFEECQRKRT